MEARLVAILVATCLLAPAYTLTQPDQAVTPLEAGAGDPLGYRSSLLNAEASLSDANNAVKMEMTHSATSTNVDFSSALKAQLEAKSMVDRVKALKPNFQGSKVAKVTSSEKFLKKVEDRVVDDVEKVLVEKVALVTEAKVTKDLKERRVFRKQEKKLNVEEKKLQVPENIKKAPRPSQASKVVEKKTPPAASPKPFVHVVDPSVYDPYMKSSKVKKVSKEVNKKVKHEKLVDALPAEMVAASTNVDKLVKPKQADVNKVEMKQAPAEKVGLKKPEPKAAVKPEAVKAAPANQAPAKPKAKKVVDANKPAADKVIKPEANKVTVDANKKPEANKVVKPEANKVVKPEANNDANKKPEANKVVKPEANKVVKPEANNDANKKPEANKVVKPEANKVAVDAKKPAEPKKQNKSGAKKGDGGNPAQSKASAHPEAKKTPTNEEMEVYWKQ
eukprot:TRINITY_DN622_c0_g1_i1.p1 TRINITY_DN622_c0_g1~~TRINITY_DN622_c0_g1_i1.p1  ORF type:complete len:447 (-),score=205.02 TRINITY_DN622_c0_g1_i1:226-1566(-)